MPGGMLDRADIPAPWAIVAMQVRRDSRFVIGPAMRFPYWNGVGPSKNCLLSSRIRREFADHANFAANVLIELCQFSCGNPVFKVLVASGFVHIKAAEIFAVNFEFQDITYKTRALVLCVPVARNLFRIFSRQYRVEDRLPGKARRE